MTVTHEHPNVTLLKRLDLSDLAGSADLFQPDVVWHYYNPNLPELQGDYDGVVGIGGFFQRLGAEATEFQVEPVAVTPVGDELVVVQTRNSMTLHGEPIAVDVVVVWRFVDGRIAEVWDIPSAHCLAAALPA